MINVPVRVKDALRDGRLKKNINVQVQKEVITRNLTKLGTLNTSSTTYNLTENGYYILYTDEIETTGTAIIWMYFPDGARQPLYMTLNAGENYLEPTTPLYAGGYLLLSSAPAGVNIYVTKKELVSYTSTWEDDFEMDNDNIVKESFSLDERMCSGDTLKFGRCEGSSIEFQYFDKPSVKGERLNISIDVQYDSSNWYSIPMGFFIVDNCVRQASTGIYKVTAYNKLKSQYLDQEANDLIKAMYDNPTNPVKFVDIIDNLLDGFKIENHNTEEVTGTRTDERYAYALSGGTIPLKAKYGINNILNYYRYAGSATSISVNGYLWVQPTKVDFTLDPDLAYRISSKYDLLELERNIYNNIKDTIEAACTVTDGFMSRFTNPGLTNYLGYHMLNGVAITDENNNVKWYSTYAYKAGSSNVVGGFNDLIHTTFTGCTKVSFYYPYNIMFCSSSSTISGVYLCTIPFTNTSTYKYYTDSGLVALSSDYTYANRTPEGTYVTDNWIVSGWNKVLKVNNLTDADLYEVTPSTMANITLRDAVAAVYEISGQFGQLDRETDLFYGKSLGNTHLYPAETLYPANNRYPKGAQISASKSYYSKLWAEENNVRKWRNLVITYKGLEDGSPATLTYTVTLNKDGTEDYICSDNWLFKNLLWDEVNRFIMYPAAQMANKIRACSWFPFEMWCAGLPYLETGDEIEIPLGENSYTSYVLSRTLKGIQNLQDTYINGTLDIF